MYTNTLDSELQRRVQSREFERSVDQAVQSFMYDLDFLLLEEQHAQPRNKYAFVKPATPVEWLMPA